MQLGIIRVWSITGILLMLLLCVNCWPVTKPEVVVQQPMMDIPQWHCLRYFKHDVHLMRRCRNHRMPLLARPKE